MPYSDWLHIAGLTFGYRSRPVLQNVSFSVPDVCKLIYLVGPSGIGKSTLLSLIAGFLQPQSGTVRVFGETIDGPSPRRPVVFQNYNLFPWKTVVENVEFGLKAIGLPARQRRDRAESLLDRLGLGSCSALYPAELSGGMQQRVGLARALVVKPPCLLMDEPFGAVDRFTRNMLLEDLKSLTKSGSMHAFVVSHNLEEATSNADGILIFDDRGSIKLSDPRRARFENGEVARRWLAASSG